MYRSCTKPVKETFSERFTWYNVSVGYTACGSLHGDDELVLALNEAQFDPFTPDHNPNHNTLCNKKVQVTMVLMDQLKSYLLTCAQVVR